MHNVLHMGQARKVLDANFNLHKTGELHPDRVLGFHDIVYILEGGWEIGQDGSRYVLEQGDVIFLHAGRHHYGVEGYLPGARTMYLHIGRSFEDAVADARPAPLPGDRLALPVVVKSRGSAAVRSLFEDIIHTYWCDRENKGIKLAALVDLLLYELSEAGETGKDTAGGLVEGMLYHIRMTPDKIFTLSELSESLHVCSRNLTDKFRKATGKSVHQYQIDLKLAMARMLIRDNPGRPFKEVACNLGFYDEFHFSRLFKRKYGFSPSGLRPAPAICPAEKASVQ